MRAWALQKATPECARRIKNTGTKDSIVDYPPSVADC